MVENALAKLRRKKLDMIVANDVSAEGSGFDVVTNSATLLEREGGSVETGLVTKEELADRILDRIVDLRAVASAAVSRA